MSKICIVSLGYMWFPAVESGTTKFFQLAQTFVDCGHEVEVVTTGFQHFKKQPRDIAAIEALSLPYKVTFIDVKPYKKNVDFRRALSNKDAAKKVEAYMEKHIQEYDLVYNSIPANNIAAKVAVLCKKNNVPYVVDVEDLWPEAMRMVVKNEKLCNLFFHSFHRDAEIVYANATAVVGTSEDYTARAVKYNNRKDIALQTFFVGCNLDEFDEGVAKFGSEIEAQKKPDEFWVTYAGSISTSYDIENIVHAAEKISKHVHFQILGTGSSKEAIEQYALEHNVANVHFWGFTEFPKMAAVLAKSDVLINSFVKGAPQSIVNKVGDYLASGKPMINTLENPVFTKLVDKYRFGINIEPGNSDVLAKEILSYMNQPERLAQEGKAARTLAETKFDRKVSYPQLVRFVEQFINE